MSIYDPIYLRNGLKYFIENAKIMVKSGTEMIDLMDLFPNLKRGYCLRPVIFDVLRLYVRIHNLMYADHRYNAYIIPDNLCNLAFGGKIRATNYIDNHSYLEIEEINETRYLNTFEMIKISHPEFNSQLFNPDTYLDIICKLNFSSYTKNPEYDNYLKDTENYRDIWAEYRMLSSLMPSVLRISVTTNEIISQNGLTVPIFNMKTHYNITEILQSIIYLVKFRDMDYSQLIEKLLKTYNINSLNYAIITETLHLINNYLQIYDPRVNHNEAYFLALNVNNEKIISLIKNNIIQRNFYDRQVVDSIISQQLGHGTNVSNDLYRNLRLIMINY